MGVGVASSGSGGQGFAFKLEGDGDSKIGNSSGDLHQFTGSVAMNENIYFLTNGRLGIGTDEPDYKLDVAGNIGLNQYIHHNGDANTRINLTEDRIQIEAGGLAMIGAHQKDSAPHQVTVNNGANNVDFVVKDSSNNQIISVDASTSRLGVNTDAPAELLHVHGGNIMVSGNDARIKIDGHVDSHPGLELYENGTRKWIIFNNYGDDSLDFKTDSNTRMVINQDGTVGIGTESPAALLSVAGVISSSHGATLGNLILQDDATSLQLSGTLVAQDISSSVGSTLGNLILNDDATSLQLSGTLVAQKISSSVGATIGNLILNDDSTSLQLSGNILMSDQASLGATAIYDPTGSSVTQVTGTLDIKGWRVNAVTRTNLGTGTTTTLTASTGVHFLDADSVNAAATGYHELTLCTGSIDGQELKLLVTGTLNAAVRLFPGASTKAVGSITSTGVASNGESITLKGPGGGTSYVVAAMDDAGLPCGQVGRMGATSYVFGINGCTTAAENAVGIYSAIEQAISSDSWPFALGSFSPGSTTVISLTASAGGTDSNQTITENMSNVTVTGMAGGTTTPSSVNTSFGVTFASNQGAHLIFDVDSNQWQIIAGTQLAS